MIEVALGIDIGGTNSKLGLVDVSGNILFESNISTTSLKDADEFFVKIKKTLESISESYKILSVGIGAPNVNYYKGTIEFAPNLNWGEMILFKEIYKKYFQYPFVLTNDANAAAMGEKRFGGAKTMSNFVVFTLGTGLGSGIVVNDEVVYGHSGFAGEIGHIIVNPKGRHCVCGRRGCLETYVSATGIKRTVYKMLAYYTQPSLLREINYNDLNAEMITEAAHKEDFIAIKSFEYTGKILGLKLADTVLYTSPEAIFLFGGLVNAGKYLLKPVQKYMEKNVFRPFKNTVKLLPSKLMNKNAAVLGVAALAWDKVWK